jgi:2-polyprenyl-3-methyl-5-hydroxy-6-metoxy-1,4-benzoquinol methylase
MSDKFVSWEDAVLWLLSQPDKKELVKDCYFDASAEEAAQRYYQSTEWCAIKEELPHNPGKVLDVGAGRGITSYALAKEGWNVVALEPDKSNLIGSGAIQSIAKAGELPISVIEGFGEEVNEEASSFDMIFSRQAMHHANNLEQFCDELYRVLKPGGTLITVRDHVISKQSDLPKFLDIHPLHNLYGGEHAYTEKQYKDALTKAGFQINKVLNPLGSPINFAPNTRKTLKNELQNRLQKYSLSWVSKCLENEIIFKLVLRVLSLFDNRPGRLYSFVCTKVK